MCSSDLNGMKHIYKKVFKSKRPSLGSTHGPGPATSTSTSTLLTRAADTIPSIPVQVGDMTASAQVTAGISVSFQLRPSESDL